MGELVNNEREEHRRAVEEVIHSGRLEGFPDDADWNAMMRRYANGELELDDLQRYADET
ncbi:antitoxin VbhA family protein [Curtobacterium sp. MCBD17_040]|uniref:antitoxin VbhA family protein n=1 Tax=Curtobacterium sp. MCBD17_040 TaxID=2175674 RepID=UPI0015E89EFC|nr:antitoxin VbhA family protein [Curtobacterium sp. MCBD17_040]WIB65278.1 antitoxin VbhA family protein [Curtobacterium sp. MCBD17_040]